MSGGATATFRNLPDAKRARVLEAAVREVAEHGYGDASMDRIAATAGVAKGSLYQYFGSKAALYGYLVAEHLPDRKREAFDVSAAARDADIYAALEAGFHAGVALFRADPWLARLGARLLAPAAEPEVEALHRAARDATHAALVALLEGAQARGEVRAEVDARDAAVWVAQLMGSGVLEALARRAGTDLRGLAERPERLDALGASEMEGVVASFGGLLRRALRPG